MLIYEVYQCAVCAVRACLAHTDPDTRWIRVWSVPDEQRGATLTHSGCFTTYCPEHAQQGLADSVKVPS